jgi:6-phosphofructokinase 1
MELKTLIVVSGGDAPGINTVLFQFARLQPNVIGARGGLPGLLNEDLIPISLGLAAPFAAQAGSILASSREPVLGQPEAREVLRRVLEKHEIDTVLLLGGNGTLHYVLPLLANWGIRCVGLPVTIDNDVPGTERTLGFDSACNFAYQAVDGVQATARALPGRIFMMETLGGNTGFLALAIGHGAGAHAVLLPEYEYTDEWLSKRLMDSIKNEGHALLVLSEGVKASRTLADEIPKWTGIRMRDIRLGHAQRGGVPTHLDRVLAAEMAQIAYQALSEGCPIGVVVVRQGSTILHEGTLENIAIPLPDLALYKHVNGLI